MIIYVAESMVLTWISLAWLTIQSALFSVSTLDAVIFYTQAVFTFLLLILLTVIQDISLRNKLVKGLFITNFALFLFYIHMFEQILNYHTVTTDPVLCTNQPHSQSYIKIFFQSSSPTEITLAFSAISFSFLTLQVILSAGAALLCESLWTDNYWCETTLFIISTVHLYISLLDSNSHLFFFLLWTITSVYLIYFIIYLIVLIIIAQNTNSTEYIPLPNPPSPGTSTSVVVDTHNDLNPSLSSSANSFIVTRTVLECIRCFLIIVWGFCIYGFLVLHTQQYLQWSLIPIFILITLVILIENIPLFISLQKHLKNTKKLGANPAHVLHASSRQRLSVAVYSNDAENALSSQSVFRNMTLSTTKKRF